MRQMVAFLRKRYSRSKIRRKYSSEERKETFQAKATIYAESVR